MGSELLSYLKTVFSFHEAQPLLFTQLYFWVFFLVVFALFSTVCNRRLMRNTFLFAASLFFYFKYAYFFTDVYNNLFHTNHKVFNYLAHWANSFNIHYFNVDVILLPVGISFFTFQIISYVVDVYRGHVKPVGNVLDFGFYVSFFPGLVAGPIVRASQFVPQIYKPYFLSKRQFGIAIFWILNGLVKKMVLSDYLAVNFIDRVFANPLMYTGFENLTALFAYSLQVYADFSGYTDIAIGVAMLMGFHLPKNFNSPYKARNPGEFWKRWHISLSNWLKDYLYIPLGGNRNATPATYLMILGIVLIIIFLAHQIWVTVLLLSVVAVLTLLLIFRPKSRKGINTMIWGGLNGLGILAYKIWHKRTGFQQVMITASVFALFVLMLLVAPSPFFRLATVWSGIFFVGTLVGKLYRLVSRGGEIRPLGTAWSVLMTFVFVTFTRLFFRSGSNLNPAEANEVAWATAKNMVQQMGGVWDTSLIPSIMYEYRNIFLLFAAGMLIRLPRPVQLLAVVLTVFVVYQFVTADLQSFIYFQF